MFTSKGSYILSPKFWYGFLILVYKYITPTKVQTLWLFITTYNFTALKITSISFLTSQNFEHDCFTINEFQGFRKADIGCPLTNERYRAHNKLHANWSTSKSIRVTQDLVISKFNFLRQEGRLKSSHLYWLHKVEYLRYEHTEVRK
jgi:hypothetical protein